MHQKYIALTAAAFALVFAGSVRAEDVPLDTYTEGYTDESHSINTPGSEPIVSSTNDDDRGVTSVETYGSTGAMSGNGMGLGGQSYGVDLGGNNYGTGPGYGNSLGISGGAGGVSGGGVGGAGGSAGGGAGGGNSAAGHGGGGGASGAGGGGGH